MNAEQARILSEENQIGLEEILKSIKSSAEGGNTSTVLWSVRAEVIPELMRMGYKVYIHKDPVNGIENHICTW